MCHLGKPDRLSTKIKDKIKEVVELTSNNKQITLGLAFNYGGRDELVEAVKRIVQDRTDAQAIDESVISRYLYTDGMPDPDLIIRTGGEKRLSNFLLWQAAYAELVFLDDLWPDFGHEQLNRAINEFRRRDRRFGGVGRDE